MTTSPTSWLIMAAFFAGSVVAWAILSTLDYLERAARRAEAQRLLNETITKLERYLLTRTNGQRPWDDR